jgi:hypothetical protein
MTRSTARLLVAMVLASSTQPTGCGREPLLVEESPPVTVRITPHHPARTPAGDSLLLAATANASDGRAVRLGSDAFVWTSADPLAVAMRPTPLDERRAAVLATAGSAAASTWVFVEVSGVGRDSVQVEVFVPSETTLRIQLLYAPDVPPRWRTFLESAALRWEWAMAGELPEVQLDSPGGDCPTAPGEPTSPPLAGAERGVRIYVGTSGRFPAGTYVEAVGGPCIQRPLPTPTTIVGAITINRDHPANGIDFQRLEYLVAHEMGHALGLVAVVNGERAELAEHVHGVARSHEPDSQTDRRAEIELGLIDGFHGTSAQTHKLRPFNFAKNRASSKVTMTGGSVTRSPPCGPACSEHRTAPRRYARSGSR